ncbi:methyltransferase domain-containing protein [bacterium]|jgi:SAM-dependent methyltransferase|nr:methyltransferase domain-containing protein [Planctomicrobium sp.]MDA7527627.1 methyltransferase domain-containing protein [bacterium]
MVQAKTDRDWQQKYETGNIPWDSELPSAELFKVLEEYSIPPGRAIELGCGTGTNAVALAKLGWKVTAVDCVEEALVEAKSKADADQVNVDWIAADVQNFGVALGPFDFVFDRGCYHCCRRVDLSGYLKTLENMTRTGAYMLCLCGNPNGNEQGGPPRVPEADLREEFSSLFEIIHLREFHFEDAGGVQGPLGWSIWMKRK